MFVMAASCFSTSLPVATGIPRLPGVAARAWRLEPARLVAPAVLALVLAAALLAPEQPAAQAEICQRHNGASACRVW